MGDIVLTCTGDLSRNRTVGLRIGKGETLASITASMKGAVAEGVLTSRSAHHLAQREGIECPVIEGIYRVGGWMGGWVCAPAARDVRHGCVCVWVVGGGVEPCLLHSSFSAAGPDA